MSIRVNITDGDSHVKARIVQLGRCRYVDKVADRFLVAQPIWLESSKPRGKSCGGGNSC